MAKFGNSMRMKYIPVHFNEDEVHLVIDPRPKNMFPSRMVVIDDNMSDEYYLELELKKVTPKHTRGMLLTVTNFTLYNQAGDVMEYYRWNPKDTKESWRV